MITKQITAANADEQIKQLYQTAFPEDEQNPWDDLVRLIGEMHLDFTAYYEVTEQREQSQACLDSAESRRNSTEGQRADFIGFTIVFTHEPFNWYWYFAVREEMRGKGYGQRILSQLIEHYKGQTCVLDMESPTQMCDNIDQRKRRHAFYLRNGFRDTNIYRTYNDITMTIMMIGEGTFTMQDWDDIVHELQQFWWPDNIKEG